MTTLKLVCYRKNMPKMDDVKQSNRLPEDVENYNTVPVGRVEELELKIANSGDIDELIDVVTEMGEDCLAFVGSRGYAYRANAMASMLEQLKADRSGLPFNVLTRGMGLREKALALLSEEVVSE